MSDKAWFKDGATKTEDLGNSAHVAHLLPNDLTQAGFWFLLQASKITTTFHSYQWMAKFITSSEWRLEDFSEFLELNKNPFEKTSADDLSFYQTVVMQMLWADEIHLTKLADILTNYLLDLIACAYRSKPALIPSKNRFDLTFVRKFRTINDAVRSGALSELERLSRSGFSETLSEAKRVTNCSLPQADEDAVHELIKLRNEIVHKQGSYPEIIASMFKKKSKPRSWLKHKPGDTKRAEVTAAKVVGLFEIAAIENGIDAMATKKEILADTDILDRT